MFNVLRKEFLNCIQVQYFSNPIRDNINLSEWRYEKGQLDYEIRCNNGKFECVPIIVPYNVDVETGEILGLQYHKIDCPFDETVRYARFISDEEVREQNIDRSARRSKNAIYEYAYSNQWQYFVTLTFNGELIDRYDYDVCTEKLSKWFNNCKRSCKDMRYLFVPEMHKDGAWHFHGLISHCDGLEFVDSGKTDDKGRKIFNVGKYKFGWSTATEITTQEQACTYLTKYTTKELCSVTYNKKRYWASRNLEKPKIEKMLMNIDKEKFLELTDLKGRYVTQSYGEYTDVTYCRIPIYTTNAP